MPNPIERAARALFHYEPGPYGDCIDWAIEQDFGWRDQVEAVKLVLRAIREPSEAMIEAGDRAEMALGAVRGIGVYGTERIWPAMIDAALEEE